MAGTGNLNDRVETHGRASLPIPQHLIHHFVTFVAIEMKIQGFHNAISVGFFFLTYWIVGFGVFVGEVGEGVSKFVDEKFQYLRVADGENAVKIVNSAAAVFLVVDEDYGVAPMRVGRYIADCPMVAGADVTL